ncbi:MAG: TerC family protein [Fimbriimonadaceae bacterium]|nr:TerC family protein [Fimbriimonadaceae bacterium]
MELAGISIWVWGGFLAFVLSMLALDLGVFHRKSHEVKMKEALTWSAVWIGIALLFNLGIYLFWDSVSHAAVSADGTIYSNKDAAMAFLAGYLIEKALSIDNIFVFIMVFAFFNVPPKYQHRVLFFGILGALIFRAAFIAAGAAMLERFFWTMLIFGGLLIFSGIKMITLKDKHLDPEGIPFVRWFKRLMPVTPGYHGQSFFTRIDGKLWATPLFISLIVIEFTDIIFAVDSIPAIFAITQNPFIVFTSNVFAILGLRALFFAISGLVKLFHYLSYGLAIILVFVGGKMLFNYAVKVDWLTVGDYEKFPIGLSLGIIVAILSTSILLSVLRPPAKATDEGPE